MAQQIESEGATPEILQIVFLKEIASRLADLQTTIESHNNNNNKNEIASELTDIKTTLKSPKNNKNNNENENEKITSAPAIRHIPYHVQRTLNAGEENDEKIKEDKTIGLKTVGRAGYIFNSGPGSIEIKIFDNNEWSDWISIAANDGINFYYEDNIWLHTIRVKASKTTAATYELAINPGSE